MPRDHPRQNQHGDPEISCYWCGTRIDYSNLCITGPYCSIACMSAKLVYANLLIAFIISFCSLYFFDSIASLLGNPYTASMQASIIIVFFFVLPVIVWGLTIYGWMVRRQDPNFRMHRGHYHPDLRA